MEPDPGEPTGGNVPRFGPILHLGLLQGTLWGWR